MKTAAPRQASTQRKPIKIGYLLKMYPRFSQTFVANEILELESQGAEISILSLRLPNEGLFHESACRVQARADYAPETSRGQIRRMLASQWKLLKRSPGSYRSAWSVVARHASANWYQLAQAAYVLRWAKKNGIKHIHVHFGTEEATVAMLAHRLGGLSYSLTLHAFDIFRDNVDKALLAKKINASRFTITVSEFNRRYMVEELPNLDAEKIRVNYNGIDLTRFTPNGDARNEPSILAVGRLIEKKGFLHLIRAVARLRDEGLTVNCVIAGEGREAATLEEEICKRNLSSHVKLVGRVRQAQVSEWLRQFRCFVLPCVQANDGNVDALPTVLLESLASGCPAISTRVSGVPEIIEDRVSGLLVEPGDEEALARAIRDVLVDGDLAARLEEGGRRRAEQRFDIKRNVAVMHGWLGNGKAKPAPTGKRNGTLADRSSQLAETTAGEVS